MSWSISILPAKLPEILSHIDHAQPGAAVAEESEEQIVLAKLAAKQIIESGAIGSDDKSFTVTIGGHANKNHEPNAAWANDMINISVYQTMIKD